MNINQQLPDENKLLNKADSLLSDEIPVVNNHIHTPYSFSAFDNIPQAVSLARKENVKVLGINDFFVTDGFSEFAEECYKQNIFPLFNIEFIGLSKTDQKNDVRVNDPNNPGRTYFSGKGLNFPQELNHEDEKILESVKKESQNQVIEMINKLNAYIDDLGWDFQLSVEEIFDKYAKKLIRERHIATALRNKIIEKYDSDEERIAVFTKIFGNRKPESSIDNPASFENEIRSKLLKTGGVAFVEEDDKAFLEIEEIRRIIINMRGIPTYPLLLDDKNGNFTDFEKDKEKLAKTLKDRGVYSIELIPHRNSLEELKNYVRYFYDQGFIISFGTEHNTPELTKLTPDCRNNVSLDEEMKAISFKGAAVIAAHQYRNSRGEEGYIDPAGKARINERDRFEKLGEAFIAYSLNEIK